MLVAALPGYVRQPRPGRRRARPKDEVLLGFEDFTARLLGWVEWWNTCHLPQPLDGKSPLQAWEADLTPVREVIREELWTFTLQDDVRVQVVSLVVCGSAGGTIGAGPGLAGTGGMPHHDHRIEVFDPRPAATWDRRPSRTKPARSRSPRSLRRGPRTAGVCGPLSLSGRLVPEYGLRGSAMKRDWAHWALTQLPPAPPSSSCGCLRRPTRWSPLE